MVVKRTLPQTTCFTNPSDVLTNFWSIVGSNSPDPWTWVLNRIDQSTKPDTSVPPTPDLVAALYQRELNPQNKQLYSYIVDQQLRLAPVVNDSLISETMVRIFDAKMDVYRINRSPATNNFFFDEVNGIRFVRPIAGLFSDLLPKAVYPHAENSEIQYSLVATRKALNKLELTDRQLLEKMKKLVSIVAATFPLPKGSRKSFTCRDLYLGCIFIDLTDRNWLEILEDLVHETIHIDTWWRWFENPKLLVDCGSEVIRSPITGNERPVATMLQAALIYGATIQLLESILLSRHAEPDEYGTVSRLKKLKASQSFLIKSLRNSSLPKFYKDALNALEI